MTTRHACEESLWKSVKACVCALVAWHGNFLNQSQVQILCNKLQGKSIFGLIFYWKALGQLHFVLAESVPVICLLGKLWENQRCGMGNCSQRRSAAFAACRQLIALERCIRTIDIVRESVISITVASWVRCQCHEQVDLAIPFFGIRHNGSSSLNIINDQSYCTLVRWEGLTTPLCHRRTCRNYWGIWINEGNIFIILAIMSFIPFTDSFSLATCVSYCSSSYWKYFVEYFYFPDFIRCHALGNLIIGFFRWLAFRILYSLLLGPDKMTTVQGGPKLSYHTYHNYFM